MATKEYSMPTEAKLGIVVGLGLLIFSAVIAAQRPLSYGISPVPKSPLANPAKSDPMAQSY